MYKILFLIIALFVQTTVGAQYTLEIGGTMNCREIYGDFTVHLDSDQKVYARGEEASSGAVLMSLPFIPRWFGAMDYECVLDRVGMFSGYIVPDPTKEPFNLTARVTPWTSNSPAIDFVRFKVWPSQDSMVVMMFHGNKKPAFKASFIYSFWNDVEGMNGYPRSSTPVGEVMSWYDNGQMAAKLHFDEQGKEDGKQVYFYENGKQKEIANYKNGLPIGEHKKWHPNGQLALDGVYGQLSICWKSDYITKKEWTVSGKLIEEIKIDEDHEHMLQTAYYPNGKKSFVAEINWLPAQDIEEIVDEYLETVVKEFEEEYGANSYEENEYREAYIRPFPQEEKAPGLIYAALCVNLYSIMNTRTYTYYTEDGNLAASYTYEIDELKEEKLVVSEEELAKIKDADQAVTLIIQDRSVSTAGPNFFPNSDGVSSATMEAFEKGFTYEIEELGGSQTFEVKFKDLFTSKLVHSYRDIIETNKEGTRLTLKRHYPSGQIAIKNVYSIDNDKIYIGERNHVDDLLLSEFWTANGRLYGRDALIIEDGKRVKTETRFHSNGKPETVKKTTRYEKTTDFTEWKEHIEQYRKALATGKTKVTSLYSCSEIPEDLEYIKPTTTEYIKYDADGNIISKEDRMEYYINGEVYVVGYESAKEYYSSGKLKRVKEEYGIYELKITEYAEDGSVLKEERKSLFDE